ncbi:subtilisin-like protein [Piromyces finnis]|uniref:Subtilisin-like protein n=1 Tax=Piromyces finnis TaxID=1754191 RepID=A0A1Y1VCE7_9FUNG|nr:subtilisin-like protein [Piromyces finnis]|eukprot:ORX52546.1 subtilisin-like protein [Piromyces finnis]
MVNERMNDIYDAISDNKDTFKLEDGKIDEKLNEIETSSLRKRGKNSNVKTKFLFQNKNRKSKTTSQGLSNSNVEYIPFESQLVSHLCPVLNYYTVKAYLSKKVAEKVRLMPNVISCEIAGKLEKPKYKKYNIHTAKATKATTNKFKRDTTSSTYYNINDIKKETGWSSVGVQANASRHLSVLSQYNYNSTLVKSYDDNYYYPTSGGQFIDMYFIDEGISVNHIDFKTYKGKTFERTVSCDMTVEYGELGIMTEEKKRNCDITSSDQFHGTSSASVAAGYKYGVAKRANIHMIATDFYDYDFLVALDYIKTHGKPYKSIINVSRNGIDTFQKNIQNKINEVVNAGFLIFASAGNDGQDACDKTYRNKFVGYDNVIGVASTFNDESSLSGIYTEAYYSNYGECIDFHAPGFVTTADFTGCSRTSSTTCSEFDYVEGTSFASPIVAGLAALIMSEHPNTKYTYKTMRETLINMSIKNIVKKMGSKTTPNRFVNNGKHIVYSSDNKYSGCGTLAGNTQCSNGCCSKDNVCVNPMNDKNGLCQINNGCQSNFGSCDVMMIDPVDAYGISLDTIIKSININHAFINNL